MKQKSVWLQLWLVGVDMREVEGKAIAFHTDFAITNFQAMLSAIVEGK